MNLAALPRISGSEFHAIFCGSRFVAAAVYVVDDDALQAVLPEVAKKLKRASHGAPGRSAAFVITDPPPLPDDVDPNALTVALTFVKD